MAETNECSYFIDRTFTTTRMVRQRGIYAPSSWATGAYWCWRWDLNPHGIATNGFWIRRVCHSTTPAYYTERLVWFNQLKVDSINKVAVCALIGAGNRGRTCTGITHQILNLARLPIPPYPHIKHTDRFKASAMPPTLRCWGASSFTPKPAKVMLPNTWFQFPIRFTVSALFVGRAWLRGQDSNLRFSAHGADEIAASLPRNISLVVQKTLFAKTHFTL